MPGQDVSEVLPLLLLVYPPLKQVMCARLLRELYRT